MKALLLYSNDIDDFINNYKIIKKFGLDEVFYMVKDYSGNNFYKSDKLNQLFLFCKNMNIVLSAWVVVQSIRYVGYYQDKFSYEKHELKSMISIDGRSTFNFPINSDGGFEDYLCPSNKINIKYINDELLKIQKTGYFSKICLDLIRYPIKEWRDYCYCDNCNKLAKERYGVSQNKLSKKEKREFNQFLINNFFINIKKGIYLPLGALIWTNYIGENVGHNQLFNKLDFRIVWPSIQDNLKINNFDPHDYFSYNLDNLTRFDLEYIIRLINSYKNNIFLHHHLKLSKIVKLMKYNKFNFLLGHIFIIEKLQMKWIRRVLLCMKKK